MNDSAAGEDAIVGVSRPAWRGDRVEERELVRAAQRGSPDAVEALVRRHWPGALRMAYVIVRDKGAAEDVAQESMLAAVQSLDRFDRRRPFAPWLHRIVTNRALDWVRARTRRAEVEFREPRDATQGQRADVALSQDVVEAMRLLSAEDRAIVAMTHLAGYSAREIGRVLDLKQGTVRSRLSRALARMRDELDESRPSNQEFSR